jgi:hypothetical protein
MQEHGLFQNHPTCFCTFSRMQRLGLRSSSAEDRHPRAAITCDPSTNADDRDRTGAAQATKMEIPVANSLLTFPNLVT